jgi:hypothetical protein
MVYVSSVTVTVTTDTTTTQGDEDRGKAIPVTGHEGP